MANQAFGYILRPPVWIGAAPEADAQGKIPVRSTVVRRRLNCGLATRVTSDGFIFLDFSDWAPGRAAEGGNNEARLDAHRHRLVVINAHLSLLLSELKARKTFQPHLMTVEERDLLTAQDADAEGWTVLGSPWTGHYANVVSSDTYERGKETREDFRLLRDVVVDAAFVESSFDRLDGLLATGRFDLLEMMDLLLRACVARMDFAPHATVLQAWGVAERLLRDRWTVERTRLGANPGQHADLASASHDARKELNKVRPRVWSIARCPAGRSPPHRSV